MLAGLITSHKQAPVFTVPCEKNKSLVLWDTDLISFEKNCPRVTYTQYDGDTISLNNKNRENAKDINSVATKVGIKL